MITQKDIDDFIEHYSTHNNYINHSIRSGGKQFDDGSHMYEVAIPGYSMYELDIEMLENKIRIVGKSEERGVTKKFLYVNTSMFDVKKVLHKDGILQFYFVKKDKPKSRRITINKE